MWRLHQKRVLIGRHDRTKLHARQPGCGIIPCAAMIWDGSRNHSSVVESATYGNSNEAGVKFKYRIPDPAL